MGKSNICTKINKNLKNQTEVIPPLYLIMKALTSLPLPPAFCDVMASISSMISSTFPRDVAFDCDVTSE